MIKSSDVPDRIRQIVVKYIARESPVQTPWIETPCQGVCTERHYPAFPPRFFRNISIKRNPRKVKIV